MGTIPNRWSQTVLGDVAVNSTAVSTDPEADGFERYIVGKHIPENSDQVETWAPVGDSDFGPRIRTIFQPGDVICTTRGPKLKVARVDFRGLGAHTNFVLRTSDPDVLIQPYLEAVVRSEGFQQHLANNFRKSVNLFVNWSDAAKYELSLPPLDEQRRIANMLRTAEVALHSLRNLLQRVQALRTSAIDELCFGSGAETVAVGNHCEMQNGRLFPATEYCEEGLRLLRPGNLDPSGYVTWDETKTKHLPVRYGDEARDHCLASGDVVINLTAQSLEDGFMGRVCLVRAGDESLLNQRIGRLRGFSDRILPEFLFRVLQTSNFRRHATGMCEGSKIKHLFWEHISRFEFPLPGLEGQARIVEELRQLDDVATAVDARVRSIGRFKHQLLQFALHDDAGVVK